LQRREIGELRLAGRGGAKVRLELERRARIELVVEVGSEERTCLLASHRVSPLARSAAWCCVRALDKRDITVPLRTAATSAISRCDSPSSSGSTNTSRYSTGSAATARFRTRASSARTAVELAVELSDAGAVRVRRDGAREGSD